MTLIQDYDFYYYDGGKVIAAKSGDFAERVIVRRACHGQSLSEVSRLRFRKNEVS